MSLLKNILRNLRKNLSMILPKSLPKFPPKSLPKSLPKFLPKSFYRFIRPLLFLLPPERAHRLTIRGVSLFGMLADKLRLDSAPDDYILKIDVLGLRFTNPFGVAAGFDKNAEVPDGVLRLGFGFAEIGTTTPRPQSGNSAPRLFRLVPLEAIINRLGFNNEGHDAVRTRLSRRAPMGIVGVNIGANKDGDDRIGDYEVGAQVLGEYASYLTINVSSPNTIGLRDLQDKTPLTRLINKVKKAAPHVPIVLKIAPDLSSAGLQDIADVALKTNIDGLIVSNTTIDRSLIADAQAKHKDEEGGLSGRPLMEKSTQVLAQMRRLTAGRITLIGVGGVSSSADAYAKIRAGASLVQLYSALIYQGPGLVGRLKRELAELLRADGYDNLQAAVGADVSLVVDAPASKPKPKPAPKLTPKKLAPKKPASKLTPKKETRKMPVTIYHNPRCSKSRETLALLEKKLKGKGENLKVVEYLTTPLNAPALKTVLKKLKMSSARDLMRRNEAEYKELGLRDVTQEAALIKALARHPKLMQRPLVVRGNKAALGRPPEQVLDIL